MNIPKEQLSPYPGSSRPAAAEEPSPPKLGGSTSARGPPNGERLLGIEEVSARTTLSRSEIYRRIKIGEFPQPVRLAGPTGARGGRVAFLESEVARWIGDRVAEWRAMNP